MVDSVKITPEHTEIQEQQQQQPRQEQPEQPQEQLQHHGHRQERLLLSPDFGKPKPIGEELQQQQRQEYKKNVQQLQNRHKQQQLNDIEMSSNGSNDISDLCDQLQQKQKCEQLRQQSEQLHRQLLQFDRQQLLAVAEAEREEQLLQQQRRRKQPKPRHVHADGDDDDNDDADDYEDAGNVEGSVIDDQTDDNDDNDDASLTTLNTPWRHGANLSAISPVPRVRHRAPHPYASSIGGSGPDHRGVSMDLVGGRDDQDGRIGPGPGGAGEEAAMGERASGGPQSGLLVNVAAEGENAVYQGRETGRDNGGVRRDIPESDGESSGASRKESNFVGVGRGEEEIRAGKRHGDEAWGKTGADASQRGRMAKEVGMHKKDDCDDDEKMESDAKYRDAGGNADDAGDADAYNAGEDDEEEEVRLDCEERMSTASESDCSNDSHSRSQGHHDTDLHLRLRVPDGHGVGIPPNGLADFARDWMTSSGWNASAVASLNDPRRHLLNGSSEFTNGLQTKYLSKLAVTDAGVSDISRPTAGQDLTTNGLEIIKSREMANMTPAGSGIEEEKLKEASSVGQDYIENNVSPSSKVDVSRLQQLLASLQKQSLFNMHMIHMVSQQLASTAAERASAAKLQGSDISQHHPPESNALDVYLSQLLAAAAASASGIQALTGGITAGLAGQVSVPTELLSSAGIAPGFLLPNQSGFRKTRHATEEGEKPSVGFQTRGEDLAGKCFTASNALQKSNNKYDSFLLSSTGDHPLSPGSTSPHAFVNKHEVKDADSNGMTKKERSGIAKDEIHDWTRKYALEGMSEIDAPSGLDTGFIPSGKTPMASLVEQVEMSGLGGVGRDHGFDGYRKIGDVHDIYQKGRVPVTRPGDRGASDAHALGGAACDQRGSGGGEGGGGGGGSGGSGGVGTGAGSDHKGQHQSDSDAAVFKHRCRLCYKVLGSDSALQIHMRSHTGERPYKCNVCGNRFTTKGNLKVHFQRHQEQYPHIRMNPNPVPEHLDHLHPPSLQQALGSGRRTPPDRTAAVKHEGGTPFMLTSSLAHAHQLAAAASAAQAIHMARAEHFAQVSQAQQQFALAASAVTAMSQRSYNHQAPPSLLPSSPAQATEAQRRHDRTSTHTDRHHSTTASVKSEPLAASPSAILSPQRPESPKLSRFVEKPRMYLNDKDKPASGTSAKAGSPSKEVERTEVFPSPLTALSSMSSALTAPPPLANLSLFTPKHVGVTSSPPDALPGLAVAANSFGGGRPGLISAGSLRDDDALEQFMEVRNTDSAARIDEMVREMEGKLSDPNECGLCHRVLSCRSALQMHYRTHTGERPYKCRLCSRTFTTKGNLKTHMSVHRTKACGIPGSGILTPRGLTPTGASRCPVCAREFTNQLVLQQHMRSHSIADLRREFTSGFPGLASGNPGAALGNPAAMLAGNPAMMLAAGFNPQFLAFGNIPYYNPANENGAGRFFTHHPMFGMISSMRSGEERELDLRKNPSDKEKPEDDNNGARLTDDEESDSVYSGDEEAPRVSRRYDLKRTTDDDESKQIEGSKDFKNRMDRHEDSERENCDDEQYEEESEYSYDDEDKNQGNNAERKKLDFDNKNDRSDSEGSVGTDKEVFWDSGRERFGKCDEKIRDQGVEHESRRRPCSSSSSEDQVPTMKIGGFVDTNKTSQTELDRRSLSDKETELAAVGDKLLEDGNLHSRASGETMLLNEHEEECKTSALVALTERVSSFGRDVAMMSPIKLTSRGYLNRCIEEISPEANMQQRKRGPEQPMEMLATYSKRFKNNDDSFPVDDRILERSKSTFAEHLENSSKIRSSDRNGSGGSTHSGSSGEGGTSSDVGSMHGLESPGDRGLEPLSPGSLERRSGQQRYTCTTCEKAFSSTSALQIHMRTHTGDRPYVCVVCAKAFTTKGNLKVHMGTHAWNKCPSRRGRRMSVEPSTIKACFPPTLKDPSAHPPPPPTPSLSPGALYRQYLSRPTHPEAFFHSLFGGYGLFPGGTGLGGFTVAPTTNQPKSSVGSSSPGGSYPKLSPSRKSTSPSRGDASPKGVTPIRTAAPGCKENDAIGVTGCTSSGAPGVTMPNGGMPAMPQQAAAAAAAAMAAMMMNRNLNFGKLTGDLNSMSGAGSLPGPGGVATVQQLQLEHRHRLQKFGQYQQQLQSIQQQQHHQQQLQNLQQHRLHGHQRSDQCSMPAEVTRNAADSPRRSSALSGDGELSQREDTTRSKEAPTDGKILRGDRYGNGNTTREILREVGSELVDLSTKTFPISPPSESDAESGAYLKMEAGVTAGGVLEGVAKWPAVGSGGVASQHAMISHCS